MEKEAGRHRRLFVMHRGIRRPSRPPSGSRTIPLHNTISECDNAAPSATDPWTEREPREGVLEEAVLITIVVVAIVILVLT